MTRTWKNATVVDMQACGSAEETHVDAMTWSTVIEGVPMTMTELYSDPNKTAKSSVTLVQSTMESPFGPLVCTLCRGSGSEAALAASKGKSCFNTIISNAAAKSPHYAACLLGRPRSLAHHLLLTEYQYQSRYNIYTQRTRSLQAPRHCRRLSTQWRCRCLAQYPVWAGPGEHMENACTLALSICVLEFVCI